MAAVRSIFACGIAVNLLGHGHPHLTKAIQEQAATLMHVSNLYGSPQGENFAQRLVDTTFADTVFFTNSGAEAVECAIKAMRAYHQSAGSAIASKSSPSKTPFMAAPWRRLARPIRKKCTRVSRRF